MDNSKMIAGRFAKLAKAKRMQAAMNKVWDNHGAILICTHLRTTKVAAKNRDCIKFGKTGSMYVMRGKNWDCCDFATIRTAA